LWVKYGLRQAAGKYSWGLFALKKSLINRFKY